MQIHKCALRSSTSLSYVLAPQALCKAPRSKAGLEKCLIRCFLRGLPEWDDKLAARLEDSEKQQE